VNKALLYYYFKGKQGLYAAAVEEVSGEVVKNALAALDPAYKRRRAVAALRRESLRPQS